MGHATTAHTTGKVANHEEAPSTHEKVLRLNLDHTSYGTFAEIGAGQEVANWFFRVGGAAGTVAKSMSAYDMKVSTEIYGPCKRYVSSERLREMLDWEYPLLIQRLSAERGDQTRFFAFADTAKARGYRTQGECHAWLGVRLQLSPGGPPHDIILHARLLDSSHETQQAALGILGVNLLHAAYYRSPAADMAGFAASLLDALSPSRVQIDMLQLAGPSWIGVDNRLWALQLVESGLTDAAMFTARGEVVQPTDALYKRSVLLERGHFRPVSAVELDMFRAAREVFNPAGAGGLEIAEMTLRDLLRHERHEKEDFLARADLLQAAGLGVLVSSFRRFDDLGSFIRRNTGEPVGIVLGVPTLRQVFDERWYEDLDGGILESFGRLFRRGVKLYVYPERDPVSGETLTAETLSLGPELELLYGHLRRRGWLVPVAPGEDVRTDRSPTDVEAAVLARAEGWERDLDPRVAELIRTRELFTGD